MTSLLRMALCAVALTVSTSAWAQDGAPESPVSAPSPPVPPAGPGIAETLEVVAGAATPDFDGVAATRRARRAAWLPEAVTIDVLIRDDRATRAEDVIDSELDDAGAYAGGDTRSVWRDDVGDRVDVRMRVSWDLTGLVWPTDALRIADAERRDDDLRRERLEDAVDWYYVRWTARMTLLTGDLSVDDRLEALATLEHATAQLDVLTGGWYRGELSRGSR